MTNRISTGIRYGENPRVRRILEKNGYDNVILSKNENFIDIEFCDPDDLIVFILKVGKDKQIVNEWVQDEHRRLNRLGIYAHEDK